MSPAYVLVQVTQYVRYLEGVSANHGVQDTEKAITCTFYGDPLGATVWSFSGNNLADGAEYGVSTSSPTTSKRVDVLTVKTLAADNDGTYTCTAVYTADSSSKNKELKLDVYSKLENMQGCY